MKKKNNPPKQQVNPVLLVVLGIVVVGFVIYQFVLQPGTTPVAVVNPKIDPGGTTTSTPVAESQTTVEALEDSEPQEQERMTAEKRNPFLVPMLYRPVDPSTSPSPKPLDSEKPEPEPKQEFILRGIFQKRNDKVALIYSSNKGYILREGNNIPETKYFVRIIQKDKVIVTDLQGIDKVLKIRGDLP